MLAAKVCSFRFQYVTCTASGVTVNAHCFVCWSPPEVILFSRSFHLLLDPGYRVAAASHTKHSVSAGTWYRYKGNLITGKNRHMPV